jgi:ribosome biogenesis GTPase
VFSSSLEALGFGPISPVFDSLHLDPSLVPARVTAVYGSQFTIDGGASGRAELSGRLRHELLPEERPTVGDWVAVAASDHLSIVHRVVPRRTQLLRQAAGTRFDLQAIAANVDTFFVVTSANRDANARRLERYLAAIAQGGAEAVVAINKIDLCTADEVAQLVASIAAAAPNIPIIGVSAATGAGIDGITARLALGRTVAFVGMSGVGKSSLVNRLLATERQATLPIDENDRGRHATVLRELIVLPDERGVLIDTPGMRSFGVTDEDGLEATFADVTSAASACRFRDCRHAGEPGCAVAEAVEDGSLDEDRVAAFAKLEREAEAAERRRDPVLAQRAKARWRAINVAQRARYKLDPKRSR